LRKKIFKKSNQIVANKIQAALPPFKKNQQKIINFRRWGKKVFGFLKIVKMSQMSK